MIYEKNNIYYLPSGSLYEIANIEIKYNRIKKKNVLVISGTGEVVSLDEPINVYTFKELEKKLIG